MGTYFIKIEDGPDVRRKILESSKASLHTLKSYHGLLKIRGEKLTQISALRTQMKELTILINRAESLLPQLSERELTELQPKEFSKPAPKVVPKAVKPEGKWVKKEGKKVFIAAPKRKVVSEIPLEMPELPPVEEAPKRKPLTELERLEAALQGIEGRLGNL